MPIEQDAIGARPIKYFGKDCHLIKFIDLASDFATVGCVYDNVSRCVNSLLDEPVRDRIDHAFSLPSKLF